MTKQRNGRFSHGYIFVFSLIVMLMLYILGLTSIQVAGNGLQMANRQRRLAEALNNAEAGADAAEAYLRSLSSPPTATVTLAKTNYGGGSYQPTIVYDSGNAGNWLKKFKVVSVGAGSNGATRTVTMQLRQQSFSLYAYFTDFEESPAGDTIWFFARDRLRGPVHTNDQFHIAWDKTATSPIFYDTVSSTSTSVDWGANGAPSSTTDWQRIFSSGKTAFTTGVDRIELPDSTNKQQVAAWGAESGFPTTNGITIPNAGGAVSAGIYIRGDATVAFSLETGTGNQVITITQGSTTKIITVNLASQTTAVKVGSTTTNYTGVPNGCIYSTGNITSLKGELADSYYSGTSVIRHNAWTVATDVVGGKDITLTDSLKYHTEPDATKPATDTKNLASPTLGLVAQNITLAAGCPSDVTLDGVVLAGGKNTTSGSFSYASWNTTKKNNLNLLGGIIQKRRGPVGTFNQSTNTLSTGYNKNYNYDPRMVDSPPPFFPTTGQYDVLSWQYK